MRSSNVPSRPVIIIVLLLAASAAALISAGCGPLTYFPEKYAIVYGVALYDGTAEGYGNNLTYTDDDARAVAELLRQKGYQVIERIDSEATLSNLTADVETISSLANEDSTFLFYFSGHGFSGSELSSIFSNIPFSNSEPDKGDKYDEWVFLYGSINNQGISNLGAALSDDMLNDITSSIPTNRKIIIIDACNSGGFIGNQDSVDGFPQNIYTGEKDNLSLFSVIGRYFSFTTTNSADVAANNALVIAAAGELEYSWEYAGYGHGAFTYFLLSSPENADFNHDGYITVLECYAYITAKIESEWNEFARAIGQEDAIFIPRVSGGGVDLALFTSD